MAAGRHSGRRLAGLSDTTPHETPSRRSRSRLGGRRLAGRSSRSRPSRAAPRPARAPAGWKVPRTPDGHPDLQGVWGNNSVTPMTRPRQWKDKTSLTDAEVEELKQMAARFVDQGGDAIFGNFVQQMLDAKDKGAFNQVSYDPTTGNYNQFWMADREWDNRTSLIIDPPDGQFPPLTPEAEARREAARTRGARPAVPPTAPKTGRCRSAASRTARRAPAPTTTATSRSSSRPTRRCCCRR